MLKSWFWTWKVGIVWLTTVSLISKKSNSPLRLFLFRLTYIHTTSAAFAIRILKNSLNSLDLMVMLLGWSSGDWFETLSRSKKYFLDFMLKFIARFVAIPRSGLTPPSCQSWLASCIFDNPALNVVVSEAKYQTSSVELLKNSQSLRRYFTSRETQPVPESFSHRYAHCFALEGHEVEPGACRLWHDK